MAYEFEDAYWEEFRNLEFETDITIQTREPYDFVWEDESAVEQILIEASENLGEEIMEEIMEEMEKSIIEETLY